jgi:uncharacterized membrane protein YebE (DUF533 family)
MADSPFLTVIRIWAATAWADGKLADAESHALRRLIDGAELDDGDREAALGFLEAPTSLDDASLGAMSLEARRGVYRAACRMAVLDKDVADSERDMLSNLRSRLGLPEDEAREIAQSVPGL